MSTDHPLLRRSLVLLVILAGVALRWPGVFANTFHADEALYATWSRLIALGQDPLLSSQMVDKPPLLFYAMAVCYPILQSHAAWVARLVNWAAGVLTIPLSARLGRAFGLSWGSALWAAALVSFSPLAVQFAPSTFTDPLFVALALAGVTRAAEYQGKTGGGAAGVLLGLALATKHQAWLLVPLAVVLGLLRHRPAAWWRRWLAGLVLPLLMVAAWQLARAGTLDLLARQWANIGGLRLARSWELAPRAAAWGRLALPLFGAGWWSALILALALAAPVLLPARRAALRLVWLFTVAYAAAHWLLAIPAWDRYLLPLLPLLAVLAGGAIAGLHRRTARTAPVLGLLLLAAAIAGITDAALDARRGTFDLGANPRADGGASKLAAYLDNEPWGTVLYDHWLSWQWRYYFLNRPVYTHWFPNAQALAEDLSVFGAGPQTRYLTAPEAVDMRTLRRAAADVGYDLLLVEIFHASGRADGVALYVVAPRDE